MMTPQFVKPYVKSNKNDDVDTEAICRRLGSQYGFCNSQILSTNTRITVTDGSANLSRRGKNILAAGVANKTCALYGPLLNKKEKYNGVAV